VMSRGYQVAELRYNARRTVQTARPKLVGEFE
jgi:hypothetical protein